MGCGGSRVKPMNYLESSEDASKDARLRSVRINSMLEEDAKKERFCLKILMLGPGGAGKSTVVKQMKILQKQTSTPSELDHLRDCIQIELLKAVVVVTEAYLNTGQEFGDLHKQDYFDMLSHVYDQCELVSKVDLTPAIAFAMKSILSDHAILQFANDLARRMETATFYFLQHVDRICSSSYVPTNDDVLNLRIPTNGAYEIGFTASRLNFRVVDVGGQKSQRRKWIKCFDGIDALMFLAALSDFNIAMEEDKDKNRMIDALEIWQFVCTSHFFMRSCIILFLNKKDALQEKIKSLKLQDYFADYKGDNSFCSTVGYFVSRFQKIAGFSRKYYCHVTCATDTQQMKSVIENCIDTIMEKNIQASGCD